eukprot:g2082.t1
MPKKIVAIDLGTSRSAYAYSVQGRAEKDVIIRVPEGSVPSVSAMKTDTAVLLRSTPPHDVLAFGRAAGERFVQESEGCSDMYGGAGVRAVSGASTMLFRWFKMGLCERRGYQLVDDPMATAEGGQQLPLMVVMTAVLRHFKQDVLAHLSSVSEMAQTVDDITWVVTIPAIYDDFAKRFMRVAANKAGITSTIDSSSLQLCLEPEAACLAVTSIEAPNLARAGTKVMILDCGGGTVDITTHEVLSMNPLRLKELLPPTGGAWGSTCVDSAFKKWCKSFLGDGYYAQVQGTSSFYNLLKQWEEGKTTFRGGEDERIRVNMVGISRHVRIDAYKMQELRTAFNLQHPSERHVKGSNMLVILPSSLVRSFFEPTVANIANCLRDVKRNPILGGLQYVFLVGGFCSSPLVQAAARTELHGGGCAVVAALRPDVAVVRGAVLFANNADVFTSRKARLTYGLISLTRYDPGNPEHVRRRSTSRCFDEDGKEMIETFSRHMTVGQDVPQDGVCPVQVYMPIRSSQSEISFRILASHKNDIEFPDKDSTFPLGKVSVPLDMTERFEKRGVEVQFVFGGTEFSVNCFRETTGKKVAQVALSLFQEIEEAV